MGGQEGDADIEEEIVEVDDGSINVKTSPCCWWMTIAAAILAVILVFFLIFALIFGGGSTETVTVVGASTGSAHVVGVVAEQPAAVHNHISITYDEHGAVVVGGERPRVV